MRSNLKAAVFGNIYQSKKNRYVRDILQTLGNLHVQTYIEENFARFIHQHLGISLDGFHVFRSEEPEAADVAISIGGDGTFLGTAAQIGRLGIPILGINTGRLGFLADISPERIGQSLSALCRGDYLIEERKVLMVEKNDKLSTTFPYALNEVAVLKHDNSSLMEISTYVGDLYLTTYQADGLIVSTPTGSTGYSLSVGGPILVPGSETICISPVAPHSLSVRPVVVRDDVSIRLEIKSRSHNFLLACDGRSESLPEQTVIHIRQAPHVVKVIKIEHKHFFDTLRDKMNWGYDQRD